MTLHNKRHLDCLNKKSSTKLVVKLAELFELLSLAPTSAEVFLVDKKFPLLVPKNFIQRIQKGNINDPLLKQILPDAQELRSPANFSSDPLHETKYNHLPGLLHKYQDRVLVLLTKACVINCRFCFRKESQYCNKALSKDSWQKILKYINQHDNIKEVILSGGDPLTVSNDFLSKYITDLAMISHLKTFRIHSRIPIVLPSRINQQLIKLLTATHLKPVLVTHCNHPNEINIEVTKAFKKFVGSNITLLNQSVLLKGVNDDVNILAELSRKLFAIGILPYYLHKHDKVIGTAHFDIPTNIAKKLIKQLAAKLPGYLVPRLVKEKPGYPSKCPL